jgi:hypothetical protein
VVPNRFFVDRTGIYLYYIVLRTNNSSNGLELLSAFGGQCAPTGAIWRQGPPEIILVYVAAGFGLVVKGTHFLEIF